MKKVPVLSQAFRRLSPLSLARLLAAGCLGLAGCATTQGLQPPRSATHWVRSDDWNDYRGVLVYSEATDGKLWLTQCTEDGVARKPVQCGFWTLGDNLLNWWTLGHSNVVNYAKTSNGLFMQQPADPKKPVVLLPVDVKGFEVQIRQDVLPASERRRR